MVIKILIFIVSVVPIYSFASQQARVYEKYNNSEVIVEKVGELACTLTYKNGDFLTTEGMPVFYTFQVELDDGALHSGLHLWLPHPMQASRSMTLAFHQDKKIYEYTGKSSEYGDAFYKTDLFDHFVKANKIIVTQGRVTTKMPIYSTLSFPRSVNNAFNQCVTNLEKLSHTFCTSSDAANQKCVAKSKLNKQRFAGLTVKDNPAYIAKLKIIEAAKLEANQKALADAQTAALAKEQAEVLLSAQRIVEEQTQKAKAKLAIEQQKRLVQAKNDEITAIEKSKAIQHSKVTQKNEVLSIFESRLHSPFKAKKYIQIGGSISSSLRADNEHRMVQRVRFDTSKGVFYYASSHAENYEKYTSLEFDFKLLKDPRDDGGFVIKMDCGSNCSSGNYAISTPKIGVWEQYRIKTEALINHPGSTLDLTKVNVPFAILPDWGKQRGVVFMIDNVRLVN
ncbi:hypothetical protein GCM10007916_25550 [Psychromonas marina]|uniref:CBM11 domain-containing protein n=1 Tax=Psychromonas marina TaxID=88364 RepID=A0ABQ6E3B5_9GAMM|nr:hypothetical protein [Psychromonas marina]GLS91486.1 hypothetical protein GCM10007916_25550 [Psychromonas marina]